VLDGVAYLGSAVLSKAVMVPLLQAGPTPGIVAELLLSVGFPTGWMGAFLVLAVASSASFLAMVVFYNSGDNRKPGQAPSKPSVRL
jgi:sugar phosphate permease